MLLIVIHLSFIYLKLHSLECLKILNQIHLVFFVKRNDDMSMGLFDKEFFVKSLIAFWWQFKSDILRVVEHLQLELAAHV